MLLTQANNIIIPVIASETQQTLLDDPYFTHSADCKQTSLETSFINKRELVIGTEDAEDHLVLKHCENRAGRCQ